MTKRLTKSLSTGLDAFSEAVTLAFLLSNHSPRTWKNTEEECAEDADSNCGLPLTLFRAYPELHVQSLNLSLHCYYMQRRIGWMRVLVSVLSLKKPSLWRRLWKPFPLLRLSINVHEGETQIDIQRARDSEKYGAGKLNCQLRLNPQQVAVVEQLIGTSL